MACALLAAGCTSSGSVSNPPPQPGATVPPAAPLARYYDQRPSWQDCGGGYQCATVQVPLDYAAPAGGDLTLHLIRLPSTGTARRIGSLLTNPGGPGVSGITFLRDARGEFSDQIRASYDVVSFDPRGIGASDPVQCISASQLDSLASYDGSPDTPSEEQGLLALDKNLADGCEHHSARILAHVGTADTAKDMDVIRAALGDARLNYLGASYGTYLGARYAELFPSKVGRFVLDGAIDPSLSAAALTAGQLAAFDSELTAFVTDCIARSDCPVGPTVAAARAQIAQLVAGTDTSPLHSNSGRPVTQALTVTGLLYPLYYGRSGWQTLRLELAQALQGNGTLLLQAADSYLDRNPDGSYSSNQDEATYAVNCLDRPDRASLAQFRAEAAVLAAKSPVFGATFAWGDLPCTVWPVPASDTPHQISAPGAAPILVVGSTGDPATPYAWAQALAAQLSSGRLLTRVGHGHTAYHRGSACIDKAIDAFLLHGTLPPIGTVCH